MGTKLLRLLAACDRAMGPMSAFGNSETTHVIKACDINVMRYTWIYMQRSSYYVTIIWLVNNKACDTHDMVTDDVMPVTDKPFFNV
jgi:hypothetical protein